jgi:hypothetical protein
MDFIEGNLRDFLSPPDKPPKPVRAAAMTLHARPLARPPAHPPTACPPAHSPARPPACLVACLPRIALRRGRCPAMVSLAPYSRWASESLPQCCQASRAPASEALLGFFRHASCN